MGDESSKLYPLMFTAVVPVLVISNQSPLAVLVEWALEDITSVMRSWAERGRARVKSRNRDFIVLVMLVIS